MKLPCELIRDLLPLYHDGVCSEASKALVQEHLKVCDACAATMTALDAQIDMPKLDTDETKPLKAIRRRSIRRSILIGLVVFLVVTVGWFSLVQNCAVQIDSDDFTVHTRVELDNGLHYVEYSHPYTFFSMCADIHRTSEGEIHLCYYRPRLVFQAKEGEQVIRTQLIDPNGTIWSDNGQEVPLTALYLGCPEDGDALLVWSRDIDIPAAKKGENPPSLAGHFLK